MDGQSKTSQEKMLTREEFATRLNISLSTVDRRLRSGELAYVQIGGKNCAKRIPESEIVNQIVRATQTKVPPERAANKKRRGGTPIWEKPF